MGLSPRAVGRAVADGASVTLSTVGRVAVRAPGAVERPAARRRRERAERRTLALGVVAGAMAATVAVGEVARVWARGSAPNPAVADDLVAAAEEAVRETVAVAREGYRETSAHERALVNLLLSFSGTFAVARWTTHSIRSRGRLGPFGNVIVADHHVHHFIPGILMAFLAGGASIVSRRDALDPALAVPFGAGVALTFDEAALLLKLDDVYWTEEGIVSVQIVLGTIALLSACALISRLLKRGERRVLDVESRSWRMNAQAPTTSRSPSVPETR